MAREVIEAEGGRIERDASGAEWFMVPERPVKPSSFVFFRKARSHCQVAFHRRRDAGDTRPAV